MDLDARDLLNRMRAIDCWAQALERVQIVYPQAHAQTMLDHQLPGKAPTNADIAEVVDDGAENIPKRRASGGGRKGA